MNEKILVVSVHPDDETLGCGGTILKYKAEGKKVDCLFVTDGNDHQKLTIPLLYEAYGFDKIFTPSLPEIILDDISLSEIIGKFIPIMKESNPDTIILPNRSDPHSDHRRVFDAFQACIKSFRFPHLKKVLMCEIQSETDFAPILPENIFLPNYFVDISEFMEEKMKVMEIFGSELLDFPLTRSMDSIRAQHRYRGSLINAAYAEAFMLLKLIE